MLSAQATAPAATVRRRSVCAPAGRRNPHVSIAALNCGTTMHAESFELLRLLSDASFHSGAALARELGAAPAAVQQALRELQDVGLTLYKVPGRGYRLAEPYDCLDTNAVRTQLGAQAQHFHLELLDVCASTNTLLLERARGGAPSGSVIACELQSAGRGRRGNNWQSGLGGSLTFSLLWRFAQGAAGLSGLSLAAGLAVARALDTLGIARVQLKWPNDLLHAGRKLSGILIELHSDGTSSTGAVIGIGLNVRLHPSVRDAVMQAVTDIASIFGQVPQRNRLLAAMLNELARALMQFAGQGFAPLRQEWMARHAHQGKLVTLSLADGKTLAGRAAGVAEDGALLLETARGVERFVSGEVSLRSTEP